MVLIFYNMNVPLKNIFKKKRRGLEHREAGLAEPRRSLREELHLPRGSALIVPGLPTGSARFTRQLWPWPASGGIAAEDGK